MIGPDSNLARRELANGYPPVPIVRHDAPAVLVTDGKTVPNHPGKRPHAVIWADKERSVYSATPATIARWSRHRDIGDHPGIGHACGRVVAADLDVRERWLAELIERLCVEMLGATRLRRIGQEPKV